MAVSKGKVNRSAMQAAVPAPINLTAAVGGTSVGLNPTIFFRSVKFEGGTKTRGEHKIRNSARYCREEKIGSQAVFIK